MVQSEAFNNLAKCIQMFLTHSQQIWGVCSN